MIYESSTQMSLNNSNKHASAAVMAEAIVAFSLAANIFQFIDSSRNLISTIRNIYSKGRDVVGENFDLKRTAQDLELVLASLRTDTTTKDNKSGSEISFQKLAEECQVLVIEMLQKPLQITAIEKCHKRDALKTALDLPGKKTRLNLTSYVWKATSTCLLYICLRLYGRLPSMDYLRLQITLGSQYQFGVMSNRLSP
jgi:hypothetical protein